MKNRPSEASTVKTAGTPLPQIPDHSPLVRVGQGGYGEVWLAQSVVGTFRAVKVVYRKNFQKEHHYEREFQGIQKFEPVSRTHPGLVAVLHIGRNDPGGYFYCIMEVADDLVTGQSIDPQIYIPKTLQSQFGNKGRLPLKDCVELGLSLSEALGHLHRHGLVHRDIKPSNIIFAGGSLKIADIGLVTAIGESVSYVGTQGYIPPEGPGCPAADIFSLGKVLSELTSGSSDLEFRDAEPGIAQEPETPAWLRLKQIIAKACELNVLNRYHSADELRADLLELLHTEPPGKATHSGAGPGLESQIVEPLPKRSEQSPPGTRPFWRRLALPAGTGTALLIATALLFPRQVGTWLGWQVAPRVKQLAVLPFTNIGGDQNSQALSDGLVETITTRLARLDQFQGSLWVVPMAEIRREGITTVRQARDAFGATMVLTGSVQREGERMSMALNLMDASNLRSLRSQSIDAPANDLYSLQDSVIQEIANMLGLALPQTARRSSRSGRTAVSGAYELYLQGLGKLARFDQEGAIDFASLRFQEALRQDPNFAPAYAGLGEAYWRKYNATKETNWIEVARTSCSRALQLDGQLASARVTLGILHAGTGDLDKAIDEFKQALLLDPINPHAYRELAQAYEKKGLLPEAEATFRKAIRLHPNYWAAHNALGGFYHRNGQYPKAEKCFLQVIDLTPDNYSSYRNLGGIYSLMGRYAEATAMLIKSLDIRPTPQAYSNLGVIDFFQGRFAEAVGRFEKAVAMRDSERSLWGNLADALRWTPGQTDKAAEAYRRAVELAERDLVVNPQNAEARASLALYYLGLNQKEGALKEVGLANAIAPENVNVLFRSALVYEQTAQRPLALQALRTALENGYSPAEVLHHPDLAELRRDPGFLAFPARANTFNFTNKTK